MNKRLTKKIIGTTVVAMLAGATLLVSTGNAKALFVFRGNDLDATGIVTSVQASSFTFDPSGNESPYTIVVNRRTRYTNGYNRLSDIHTGDAVRVRAELEDGDFVASRVRPASDFGSYGGDCDRFVLSTAVYNGPNGDSFVANKDGIPVTLYFTTDTEFRGGTASSLLPGTEIRVVGKDCTSDGKLIAEKITIFNNIGLRTCRNYGRNSIVVYNQSPLIANDAGGAALPAKAVSVPAGRYKIIGVSYDNHSLMNTRDTAPKEQWLFTGLSNSAVMYTSGATNDLPTNRDFNLTVLSRSTNLPALDQIQLKHAAYPDAAAQSIYPVCVVFQPVSNNGNDRDDDRDRDERSNRNERDSSNDDILYED